MSFESIEDAVDYFDNEASPAMRFKAVCLVLKDHGIDFTIHDNTIQCGDDATFSRDTSLASIYIWLGY